MLQLLALVPSLLALLALIIVTVTRYRRLRQPALLHVPIAFYIWPIAFAIAYLPVQVLFDSTRVAVALSTAVFAIASGVVIARAAMKLERAVR